MSEDQLQLIDFLEHVWGVDKCTVFLAEKPKPAEFRVPNGQVWPDSKESIAKWLIAKSKQVVDVYYAPPTYKLGSSSMEKENVLGSKVLHIDLDGNAVEIWELMGAMPNVPKPSARLSTGRTGHEHWYWFLDARVPQIEHERVNKALTYYLKADQACWNINHVYRPPFTRNCKIEESTGKPRNLPVDFISYNPERVYSLERFSRIPTPKESVTDDIHLNKDNLPDIQTILAEHVWDTQHYDLFTSPDLEKVDRSSSIVRLAYFAAETGMSDEEIWVVLDDYDRRIGKFVGRADRERRLVEIIVKARTKYPYKDKIPTKNTQEDIKLVYGIKDLLAADFQLDWLIEGLLPKRTINFIAAESGIGKSRLSMQLALASAQGKQFFKWNIPERIKTLYVSLEMSGDMLKYFATQMVEGNDISDEDNDYMIYAPVGAPIALDQPEGRSYLEDIIKEYRPELVVLDALGSLTFEEMKEKPAKDINNALKALIEEYDTTFIMIHHNRKTTDKRPELADIYGSQYVVTDAALVLSMWNPTPGINNNIHLYSVKTRAASPIQAIHLDGTAFNFVERTDLYEPDDIGTADIEDSRLGRSLLPT